MYIRICIYKYDALCPVGKRHPGRPCFPVRPPIG